MVFRVCNYLLKAGIPFFTEFRMRDTGLRPDIVCPTHIKKIIEVFDSEDERKFNERKRPHYPVDLQDEFIFVDAKLPFDEKLIL